MRRAIIFVALTFACALASAATREEVMASRYLRTQFCIERALGQRWHERYQLPLTINRWGISEAGASALAKGPVALRAAHVRCRKENDIADEPLPP